MNTNIPALFQRLEVFFADPATQRPANGEHVVTLNDSELHTVLDMLSRHAKAEQEARKEAKPIIALLWNLSDENLKDETSLFFKELNKGREYNRQSKAREKRYNALIRKLRG